jgi:hypothetical protein
MPESPPRSKSANRGILAGSTMLAVIALGAGAGAGIGALVGAIGPLVAVGVLAGVLGGIGVVYKRFGDI